MTIKVGVVMDPIGSIKSYKDSTFAMLLEAQKRNWQIFYMEQQDLWLSEGSPAARMQLLEVEDNKENWFRFTGEEERPLADLDVILMRKDPPFDMEFIYTTYLLERAEDEGVLIVNKPQSLRDANEKLFTAWFSECCPPTLVTRKYEKIKEFLEEHQKVVVKPLDGMGGQSIFLLEQNAPNIRVILETLTQEETRFAMAQRYISDITMGDKRILMINGEPFPYLLARIPPADDFRGNLAVGGRGEARELSKRDQWICEQVGPVLKEKGLIFVGLDVIGDYLTEINVTSPTGIREIDSAYDVNVSAKLMDAIEGILQSKAPNSDAETQETE